MSPRKSSKKKRGKCVTHAERINQQQSSRLKGERWIIEILTIYEHKSWTWSRVLASRSLTVWRQTSSSSAGTRLSTQLLAPSMGPHLILVGMKLSVSSWERKSLIQSFPGGNQGQRAREASTEWFRRCFPQATPFVRPRSVPCGDVQKTEQLCQKYLTVFQELSLHSL